MQVTGLRTRPCARRTGTWSNRDSAHHLQSRRRVLLGAAVRRIGGREVSVITPKTGCLSWTRLASSVSKHKWNMPRKPRMSPHQNLWL